MISLDFKSEQGISLAVSGDEAVKLDVGEKAPGSTDYTELMNKPSIESVILQGNKTFKQLGLEAMSLQDIDNIIYGME